jgi:hypothetical protein
VVVLHIVPRIARTVAYADTRGGPPDLDAAGAEQDTVAAHTERREAEGPMSWSDQAVITGHLGLWPTTKRTRLGESVLRLCPR